MVRLTRERVLAWIGCFAGLLAGEAIWWAGFGGFNLWFILVVAIPILLSAAGARAMYTFVLAGVSLMAPVQVHAVLFGIRSHYYKSYGVRWEDVRDTTILWAGAVSVAMAVGLVVRHFPPREASEMATQRHEPPNDQMQQTAHGPGVSAPERRR